ncbi:NAD/NADP transhydrogenase alpha subunit-like protein [Azospirillum sp.]|uniref:NAD/NADP transhydrogenase alpha subunit-like protein n=1 Tax=Azospirillum sp. TaxID=34012 RepID=UPI002D621675|nr:NAD/NADP transhydrogenase alpha subunit-like protein [Azospirillum sp.]HYD63887.1 NAD/NADP transhydrogenase alpha subunit-like protein [Azospirillum sp.]
MRVFRTFEDAMGAPTDIATPSDTRYAVVLAAGVPKSVAVPAGATSVIFNATAPFWVQYGAAAAVPAADNLGGGAPELSPAARRLAGVASLGLVASEACVVSLSFFGG